MSDGLLVEPKVELEANLDESLWIQIRHKGESLLLCNAYRPPNTPVNFWNRLNVAIDRAFEISTNIVFVGDLNEDQLNIHYHNSKDIMLLNNLINVIEVPTRITNTSQTLLDPIVIQSTMQVLHCGVTEISNEISDHFATNILLSFSYKHRSSTVFKRTVWLYNKDDFEKLNMLIFSTNWQFHEEDTLDKACESFTSVFIDLLKNVFLVKKKQYALMINHGMILRFESTLENAIKEHCNKKG